ncbi:MAG: DUF4160 domain-containing protein [Bacteroidota bacterium]
MPTVARIGPYRLAFWSQDCAELPHVHVHRDQHIAKFWLEPVRLDRSGGFRAVEIRRIEHIVSVYASRILEKWHEHCS